MGKARIITVAGLALAFGMGLLPPQSASADGDADHGERLYRTCAACHMIGEGAINRIGPNLNGLIGRQVAVVPGYDYSDPLRDAGAEGRVWSEAALDRFLENPRGYLPGTSMVFRGMRDAEDRADLIAYILSEGGLAAAAPEIASDNGPPPEIAAILEIPGDVPYGEFLSSECTACHLGAGGEDIPSIRGLAPSVFISGLVAYRSGDRGHQVMNMLASRLGDEEIAALAAYFETAEE